jgi:hypothetical protein
MFAVDLWQVLERVLGQMLGQVSPFLVIKRFGMSPCMHNAAMRR